jgi:2-polyprenyl-6-methoxyphenol hydroxylase-like FAD-dependent oxidoreductase
MFVSFRAQTWKSANCNLDRGEGFNHALMDVHKLLQAIESRCTDGTRREDILREYEDEVRTRGQRSALMCRDACLEVHQFDKLGDHSVVRKRAFERLYVTGSRLVNSSFLPLFLFIWCGKVGLALLRQSM